MSKRIPLNEALNLIMDQSGKIASAKFIKRTDGSVRKMTFRTGVKKHLTGEGAKFSFREKSLIPVFDMQKKGYRSIPTEGIQELTVGGNTYIVDHD